MFQIHFCFSFLLQVTGFFPHNWLCSGFSVILSSGCDLFQIIGQSMPALLHLVQGVQAVSTSVNIFNGRKMLCAILP